MYGAVWKSLLFFNIILLALPGGEVKMQVVYKGKLSLTIECCTPHHPTTDISFQANIFVSLIIVKRYVSV